MISKTSYIYFHDMHLLQQSTVHALEHTAHITFFEY